MPRLGLDNRTTRLISGKCVWREITPVLEGYQHTITAAIAYIGSQAAQYLLISADSSIVVDASERSVMSGSTDPRVLLAWVKGGVKVYSLANLHAKMILADSSSADNPAFLAVGSANASSASANRLYESIMLTDNDETIEEARTALIEWKTRAGSPLSIKHLEELVKQYKADDNGDEEPEGDSEPDDDDDDEYDDSETPWPRATSLHIAPIGLAGDPSEQALHKQEELGEQYDCAEEEEQYWFDIKMFWWDQDTDPTYSSEGTYPEGSHVIVINGTKSGKMRATSKLSEPGRVVHRFTEDLGRLTRTYYYLHTKLSDEEHTLADLKAALASVNDHVDYDRQYLRRPQIDAMLDLWTDIDYDEDQ
ncbi:hypothetical protein O4160_20790 [Rhodococcus sp. IEGM 1401]|uniref:hypothetical protein n=1 Tax=unclassified Rhodococcus (in: high G+C Gram-positive bacteria) TaxID=192944 RepID=UPI0022B2D018|nr:MULTISPECIES: hypothetical protein [unclassified Rhodococcus (in: high G+C Gram-positive bacteria)]MCZ4563285.1 hypothetical protein [Rhodococcus sp. IEGM 1401]MDI9923429.1 hypothetical protein [Rhodococcus sp. IEGM 1372]MDV8035918.1 hypothetical protein [Rhodococcus sp. IEGM 1414]